MSKDFWIGIDQTLNTRVKLCDGYGKPDEMFSARFRVLISFIFGSFYVNARKATFLALQGFEGLPKVRIWTAIQNRAMARFWRSIFQ